jgi:DNA modification methylase
MGVGSTGLGALQVGRKFIGIKMKESLVVHVREQRRASGKRLRRIILPKKNFMAKDDLSLFR